MPRTTQTKKNRPTRDSALTRTTILDSAERIFAHKGLRGTRTEDIAAMSGVTKAMIHYYFSTKEKLYQAVLKRVFQERVDGMDFASLRTLPAVSALKVFAERLLAQMCRKPHLGPLFALENAQNDGTYYQRSGGELYRVLTEILERGLAEGSFRKLDPRHTAINIMGACVHHFNVAANVQILWPRYKGGQQALMQEHARAAVEFITAAIVLDGADDRRTRSIRRKVPDTQTLM
jgi:AcrR family transcriptional regulator